MEVAANEDKVETAVAVAPQPSAGSTSTSDTEFMANLYQALVKLLDKAGLNEKCTPAALRNKCAANMGMETGALDGHQVVIHKMVIRWWKSKGEEALKRVKEEQDKEEQDKKDKKEKEAKKAEKSDKAEKAAKAEKAEREQKEQRKAEKAERAASSSSAKPTGAPAALAANPEQDVLSEIYKKLRLLAKDLNARAFMEGIHTLESTKLKVQTLRQRFLDADMFVSEDPTDAEMQAIRDKHAAKLKAADAGTEAAGLKRAVDSDAVSEPKRVKSEGDSEA